MASSSLKPIGFCSLETTGNKPDPELFMSFLSDSEFNFLLNFSMPVPVQKRHLCDKQFPLLLLYFRQHCTYQSIVLGKDVKHARVQFLLPVLVFLNFLLCDDDLVFRSFVTWVNFHNFLEVLYSFLVFVYLNSSL